MMPSFLFTCFVNLQAGKRTLEARQRKAEEKSRATTGRIYLRQSRASRDGRPSSCHRTPVHVPKCPRTYINNPYKFHLNFT